MCKHEVQLARFGDDRGVGSERGERIPCAPTTELLIGDECDNHVAREFRSPGSGRSDHNCRNARLHVERATPEHVSVAHFPSKRVADVSGHTHGIHVAIQQEATAPTSAAATPATTVGRSAEPSMLTSNPCAENHAAHHVAISASPRHSARDPDSRS